MPTKRENKYPLEVGSGNKYRTSDIDIASTLICKGYQLSDLSLIHGNKAIFLFENNPNIEVIVRDFWNDQIEVFPLKFSNIRKNLKSQVYTLLRSLQQ